MKYCNFCIHIGAPELDYSNRDSVKSGAEDI